MTDLERVYDYHRASKHQSERYAPGPGGLDWANQPDPFRVFAGTPSIELPLGADAQQVLFDRIRTGERPGAVPVDLAHLGVFLELALGLSALKSAGDTRWALRCNPSSGNLHPTECYLIADPRPDLAGGVWHYVSRDHRLEYRARDAQAQPTAPSRAPVVLALTSIHWRESWKYGLRAYRYCQLDLGHALAAATYAAAVLGWRVGVLPWGDRDLARLLGLDRRDDFDPGQGETPDLALWVGPQAPAATQLTRLAAVERHFSGQANRLSGDYRHWPGIETVEAAGERPAAASPRPTADPPPALPPLLSNHCGLTAADLIRQRRSAQDFDGISPLPTQRWFAMLDALLPRPGVPPLDAWAGRPRVHLALFVHRVTDITPGLYLLVRDGAALPALRASLRRDWRWDPVPGAPAHLPLYALALGETQVAARQLACHQDIAADSAFAVGMLADFDTALAAGPWHYRELFWECGLLGQVLYLEAEAAGVRGTGIGCFFDDAMHRLLGIADTRWQSLYHFTVGTPVDDPRLRTQAPYTHWETRDHAAHHSA
ncbi:SagB/ThcOx family dehydrogenase [uncultured Thiodictyon sp.]|uniref:SagB/ThcOx family dehydrogenase n=1 Tax=uncultured Thiodictyon sp. TaxID=1846217 RepID=UPI0025E9C3F7|nr:SagB/ThcOx family dehydrogenase [uncultured Thiodictyon sp.]